eukprot:Seg3163.6 transcript_id=Seg3163.6/GoldUCD/mRNA.D3Y31 product="alpha-1A adrenergic receptor" protein_id=Seg3163.6/GoldUCD/D3Y31
MTFTPNSTLNTTTNRPGGSPHTSIELWVTVLRVVIMVLIFLATITGNVLVCMCIYCKKEMRSVTGMFLASLAVSDLGVGICCLPIAIAAIFKIDILSSKALCNFNAFSLVFFFVASINTIMATSVYKYLTVGFPMNSVVTKRRVFYAILLIWATAFILAIGPVFGWNHYFLLKDRYQCSPKPPITANEYSHLITLLCIGYAIPLPIMIFCYGRIYCISKSHFRRMRQNSVYDETLLKSEAYLIDTLLIVLVAFILCWFPFVVYVIFGIFHFKIPIYLPIIAFTFGYGNSSINPIVYALRLPSFRQGFKEMVVKCFKKKSMAPAYVTYSGNRNRAYTNHPAVNSQDTIKSTLQSLRKVSLAYVVTGSRNHAFVIKEGEKALKTRKFYGEQVSPTGIYPRIPRDSHAGDAITMQATSDVVDGPQKVIRSAGSVQNEDTVFVFDVSKDRRKKSSANSYSFPRLYPRLSRDESSPFRRTSSDVSAERKPEMSNGHVNDAFDNIHEEAEHEAGDEVTELNETLQEKELHGLSDNVIILTETRYETFNKIMSFCQGEAHCKSPKGEFQVSRCINTKYDIHVIKDPSAEERTLFGVPCIHKVLKTITWEDSVHDSIGNVVMKTRQVGTEDEVIDCSELPAYMREHVRLEA